MLIDSIHSDELFPEEVLMTSVVVVVVVVVAAVCILREKRIEVEVEHTK